MMCQIVISKAKEVILMRERNAINNENANVQTFKHSPEQELCFERRGCVVLLPDWPFAADVVVHSPGAVAPRLLRPRVKKQID